MTRGRDRPHRLAGMWQEQACHRRRLSTALEETQFGVQQTDFPPEPCSAAAALLLAGPAFRRDVPAVGVAHWQAPADHDIAQSTQCHQTGTGHLIFGLNFLHYKQPLPLRLQCNRSANSARPGPHARPRPWLSRCLTGVGLHLVLFGGDTHQRVLHGQSAFL